jgi:type III restriction enzyme
MALLEYLIKDIADTRLRNQIAAELSKLKARKKFGLVFEQHLPEIVQLPGLAGHESVALDPESVFLWISDSPELNIQSKEKIEAASDVFPRSRLIVIENDFNFERLSPGHIYFLNTQKLGVSSLLTKPGDGRTWTIWQTIENTAKAHPTHLNVIVDEAHRGMGLSAKAENNTRTLIQRFVKGAPEVGLAPVPLVIGMSATRAIPQGT